MDCVPHHLRWKGQLQAVRAWCWAKKEMCRAEAVLPSLHDSQVCEPGWSGNKMENIVPVRRHLQIGGGTPYTGSNDTSETSETSLLTWEIWKEGGELCFGSSLRACRWDSSAELPWAPLLWPQSPLISHRLTQRWQGQGKQHRDGLALQLPPASLPCWETFCSLLDLAWRLKITCASSPVLCFRSIFMQKAFAKI